MNNRTKRLLFMMLRKRKEEQGGIEGVPPLSFTAGAAGVVTDYRIYGSSASSPVIGKNKFNDSLAMGFLSYPDSVVDDRVTRQHQVGSTQLDAGTYTVSWKTTVGYCNVMVYIYDSNGIAVSRQPNGWSSWSYSEAFTLNEPGSVRLVFRRQNDRSLFLRYFHRRIIRYRNQRKRLRKRPYKSAFLIQPARDFAGWRHFKNQIAAVLYKIKAFGRS